MAVRKKAISIIILISTVIVSFALISCRDVKPAGEPLDKRIVNKLYAYTTDLDDSAETLTDNAAIAEYLCSWAKSKSVDYTVTEQGNIIMTADSSMKYYNAPPTVIVCPYDSLNLKNTFNTLAVAMYIIKNNEDTGKLNVIFTPAVGDDLSAASSLDSACFPDGCSIFTLSPAAKSLWSINSGGYVSYSLTGAVATKAPSGETAYTVTIDNIPAGIPDAKISSVPNAIKTLGSMLASFKTNAQIFEVSSIAGGTNAGLYPSSASVTIVVSKDDAPKFKTYMDTEINGFIDTYSDDYPDISFSYAQTSLPETVFDENSQNSLISALYSLINGIYSMNDDGDVTAMTNIGTISSSGTSFIIGATGMGFGSYSMSNIDNDFSTICAFSGITCTKAAEHEEWSEDTAKLEDDGFIKAVTGAYKAYVGDSLRLESCVQPTVSYYISKLTDADIMNVAISRDSMQDDTGAIITYLIDRPHEDI